MVSQGQVHKYNFLTSLNNTCSPLPCVLSCFLQLLAFAILMFEGCRTVIEGLRTEIVSVPGPEVRMLLRF